MAKKPARIERLARERWIVVDKATRSILKYRAALDNSPEGFDPELAMNLAAPVGGRDEWVAMPLADYERLPEVS